MRMMTITTTMSTEVIGLRIFQQTNGDDKLARTGYVSRSRSSAIGASIVDENEDT